MAVTQMIGVNDSLAQQQVVVAKAETPSAAERVSEAASNAWTWVKVGVKVVAVGLAVWSVVSLVRPVIATVKAGISLGEALATGVTGLFESLTNNAVTFFDHLTLLFTHPWEWVKTVAWPAVSSLWPSEATVSAVGPGAGSGGAW